jgi:CheY-like chemotaxis protein
MFDVFMDLSTLRLLVVDDDSAARDLLAEALAALGAEVRVADSAAAARAALSRQQADVIISDVGMPDEDGCELLRTIRQLERAAGGRVPAIAFTASADAGTRERALACGFDAVVTKPLNIGALARIVSQVAETADRLPVGTVGPVARDS